MRHSAACSQHSLGVAKRSIDHAHASRIKTCRAPVGRGPFSSSRLSSITLISLHITPYHSISLHHYISVAFAQQALEIVMFPLCNRRELRSSVKRPRSSVLFSEHSRILGVKRLSPGEFVQLM